ncbi:hypothetical protein BpHYR1_033941 [Brachionus plicatilis]|uniref:Uncharacterized protein n=1 Tax=Brachionus plicatilis TaxID=10195 RepID=A0A3M7PZ87_BRAPC|nr:hypothetical protein BpHYR1_033941 [Brachionus plicatilis]
MNSTIETCSGGPVQVIGTAKCIIQVNKFEGEVEVIVVKKLVYDCLLGLDVAFRMPEVKMSLMSDLVSIRDIFSNTRTPRKTSVLKIQPSLNYSNSLPNTSKIDSMPRNDTEDENKDRQLDTDELSKIDGFATILHEEFSDIVAQGLCTLTQTDICEHQIYLIESQPIKQPRRTTKSRIQQSSNGGHKRPNALRLAQKGDETR